MKQPVATKDFWARVNRLGPRDCWLWTGAVTGRTRLEPGGGYGVLYVATGKRRRQMYAHRFVYLTTVGPIRGGHEIDHKCRTTRCVNPGHLEAVTRRENQLRSPLTFAGVNTAKTHCRHGHEFNAENTWVDRYGKRYCRQCRNESIHRLRAKRRAG